jgi:hypothetical protein
MTQTSPLCARGATQGSEGTAFLRARTEYFSFDWFKQKFGVSGPKGRPGNVGHLVKGQESLPHGNRKRAPNRLSALTSTLLSHPLRNLET